MSGLLSEKAARLVADQGPDMPVPVSVWTIALTATGCRHGRSVTGAASICRNCRR